MKRRLSIMRSWYMLMAIFVTILAIMAFLLGSIGHPDRIVTYGPTVTTGYRLPQGSPDISPCPWHLENITIRDSHERDTVDNDVQQEPDDVSLGFASGHHNHG
jgi:hypothetical protein